MRRLSILFAPFLILMILSLESVAQTTSWKGTASTTWTTATNWTNGVPTAALDAIIGDANFTGVNQPTISSTASCKSLTVGGAVTSILTMKTTTTLASNLLLNSNGTIIQTTGSFTIKGNWVNNGTYSATGTASNVIFGGTTQTIQGNNVTIFRRITVNAGSITTLGINTTISGASSLLTVKGTLHPGLSPLYKITGTDLTVSSAAILKVTGALFADNYTMSGTVSFAAGSIVDYAGTINQTLSSAYLYSTINISGSGTKSLAADLQPLRSSSSTYGRIYVNAGTLDLGPYTANRSNSVAGGSISVANGATLKIGGTNPFPANFTTSSLSLNSTVEYNGESQTVASKTYGNLILNSSLGAVTKTFPATAFTVAGNFTSSQGLGSSVSFTAASAITINGDINIGASTSFNGGAFSHKFVGDWTNNGTFTGNASTITFSGSGSILSGSGVNNFFNLTFTASNITASGSTAIAVGGNLSTSGAGLFTQLPGGTLTMSGATKTIAGTNITLANFTVTGSTSTASSITVTGNMDVSGSFSASAGVVTMTGTSKTISGAGAIAFKSLKVSGSATASTGFGISSTLDVSGTGTLLSTSGNVTFTLTSTVNGAPNLYNVIVNGTSLILGANSVLGVANTLTMTAGTLNVTSNKPNTVAFNGAVAQSVNALIYHHLSLLNGNTKTATGATTVNGNLTIAPSTTFAGSSFTHTLVGNWINNGTFTAGTSTVSLTGASDAYISGATTFNVLTINKTAATNVVTLQNDITVPLVNMLLGKMLTGSNAITITNDRTGNGIILGTITRTHAFSALSSYAFEGPANTIAFTLAIGVTSITVRVAVGTVADYPNVEAINRVYDISVPSGTYIATLRLHYEDVELNGNVESSMQLSRYNGSSWTISGKTGNNTTTNYVEQALLSNITNRWTCSGASAIVRWNGSVSSDWNTVANWTVVTGAASRPPSANDIVQLGTGAFTNQPAIATAVTVKNLVFGSVQAVTLTVNSPGSLTSNGNLSGTWSTNQTHTINSGNQNLTINGDLQLSDGTTGHAINLSVGTGTVTIAGSVIESGGANITFTGAGTLAIKNDFTYSSGTFTGGTGTVLYNGTATQSVAPVTYNNLTINKASSKALANSVTSISGNLLISAGSMDFNANATVAGNVNVNASTNLYAEGVTINIGGDWTNAGTFTPGTGLVVFDGTAAQAISATTFNNVTVSKASGTATLSGNGTVNGNFALSAGTFNLATNTFNRGTNGGVMTIGSGATLLVGGSNNFPQNYATYSLDNASLVRYTGTVAQTVAGVPYGNLNFSNSGNKTINASLTVNGDLSIDNTATLDGGAYNISIFGNWVNNGVFVPSTGIVILNGAAKTVTGNTTFNNLTVYGSYTVAGANITYNGLLNVTLGASYAAGSGTATLNGDLTNSGSLTSSGTTTFTGTSVQTIHLNNALVSTSTGIVNFNGTVSPVLNSTSKPIFFNLNINNTEGVNPSVDWLILGDMSIGSGGIFNGGYSTHGIRGNFTNNGTLTSTGAINFEPGTAVTIKLSGTEFTSSGIVAFGGTGAITVTGTPTELYDLRITNSHANGIVPPSGWTITNDFIIGSNSKFIAGGNSFLVGGDIESNGELDGGTSTFTMSGAAGQLTGSPNTSFNHFTITGNITTNSDFNVSGNFINNGDYDGTSGTLIMTGSNAATIGGSTIPSTISLLTIAKTGSAVVTQAGNISDVLSLFINSGMLFTGTNTITQSPAGGLLLISNDATLKLGGNNSIPGFSAFALDVYSTVDYAGTTQTVGNAAVYGNLTVSAAGNKNAQAALVMQNNFTLTAGTFITGVTVTHSIGGNWIMTGGTFVNTGSTILFNGTTDQDIASTGAFNNMTINKTAGKVTLSSNVTNNAILTLTQGKVVIGSNNIVLGPLGSITGASTASYIVADGTGVLSQTIGSSGTKNYPVGLANYYTPASVSFTAGSTPDVVSVRMFPAVYHGGISGSTASSFAVNATWMVSEAVAGGSNATLNVQWPAALEMSGFNRNLSRLAHFANSLWEFGSGDIWASGSNPYNVSRASFTSFGPFGVSTYMVLPVTWLSINGYNSSDNNYINWSVAAEFYNDHYEVEVSTDNIHFNMIGKVKGVGTTNDPQQYSFTHRGVTEKVYYYRVKQVSIDGRFSYSKTVVIRIGMSTTNEVTILSNPVIGEMGVSISSKQAGMAALEVVDAMGHRLYQARLRLGIGNTVVQVPNLNQAAGMYYLVVVNEDGTKTVKNFIRK